MAKCYGSKGCTPTENSNILNQIEQHILIRIFNEIYNKYRPLCCENDKDKEKYPLLEGIRCRHYPDSIFGQAVIVFIWKLDGSTRCETTFATHDPFSRLTNNELYTLEDLGFEPDKFFKCVSNYCDRCKRNVEQGYMGYTDIVNT